MPKMSQRLPVNSR